MSRGPLTPGAGRAGEGNGCWRSRGGSGGRPLCSVWDLRAQTSPLRRRSHLFLRRQQLRLWEIFFGTQISVVRTRVRWGMLFGAAEARKRR